MRPASWLKIQTPAGRPEDAALMNPLPPGPYLILSQHSPVHTEWNEAKNQARLSDSFYLAYGMVVYVNCDGKTTKVGYWYDTSD